MHRGPGFAYENLGTLSSITHTLKSRNPENIWYQIVYEGAEQGFAWMPTKPTYYSAPEPCNFDTLSIAQPLATMILSPTLISIATTISLPTPVIEFTADF